MASESLRDLGTYQSDSVLDFVQGIAVESADGASESGFIRKEVKCCATIELTDSESELL